MEDDDKKAAAAKATGTSATDHQDEDGDDRLTQLPLDSSFSNQLQIKEEPSETETSSKKRKRGGGDVAMDTSSTFPVPLDSSPILTPKKRKEGPSLTTSSETPPKRKRGRPSGSGSKDRKEGPSGPTSVTTSAKTPTKRRRGRPFGTSGGIFTPYVIQLNAGQDVVEVLYNVSVENPQKTFTILSVLGPVKDIVNLTQDGPTSLKGPFEMHLLSINRLVDDDGRHCREKATCKVSCIDANGDLFAKTSVNSLKAAGRVQITAGFFNTETAKKSAARFWDFSQNDEHSPIAAIPLQMFGANIKEPSTTGILPTTPTVGDGNINNPTSATTSASNDQDIKSPSVEKNDQDMKSPSV